jgi:hypothetical protein
MAHRIRYAMARPPLADKLQGIVEADETYTRSLARTLPAMKRLLMERVNTSVVTFISIRLRLVGGQ